MTRVAAIFRRLRRPRIAAEADLQRAVCDALRKSSMPNVLFHSVPNERQCTPAAMAALKGMGLLPGVADLLVVVGACAHYLELKSPRGRQSVEQRAFQLRCELSGIPYAVADNIDDALRTLREWNAIRPDVGLRRRAA